MTTATPTETVMAIGKINLTGNVTPSIWWRCITLPSGRPDQTAITLLSEIVYWYRPAEVRNETTGELTGHRKRFRGDKLQRSYQAFADQFGFGKRETADALKRLRDAGLITLELRTLEALDGVKCSNVLFVGVNPDAIAAITNATPVTSERNSHSGNATPVTPKRNTPERQNGTGGTPIVDTNTEITTEIKNTKNTVGASAGAPAPKRQKKTSFEPAQTKPENVSDEIWRDWIKFRREKRQPLTETTCAYQARQLAGHQNADEVIRRSIASGWQGLFPDRVPNTPPVMAARDLSHLTDGQRQELALYELLEGR